MSLRLHQAGPLLPRQRQAFTWVTPSPCWPLISAQLQRSSFRSIRIGPSTSYFRQNARKQPPWRVQSTTQPSMRWSSSWASLSCSPSTSRPRCLQPNKHTLIASNAIMTHADTKPITGKCTLRATCIGRRTSRSRHHSRHYSSSLLQDLRDLPKAERRIAGSSCSRSFLLDPSKAREKQMGLSFVRLSLRGIRLLATFARLNPPHISGSRF